MNPVPVLEVGGTHVTAAAVDTLAWTVTDGPFRLALDSHGGRAEIVATFLQAAGKLGTPGAHRWGIAMPDPFDYRSGVALFHDVGKFEALAGVDLGAALRAGLQRRQRPAAELAFVNDADAFALGEWLAGAAAGSQRCVGLTLGTGVGSGWIAGGRIVSRGPGVPPGGRIHQLTVDGRPLEERMSRRAILRSYRAAGGDPGWDVREIADAARAGEPAARTVLAAALRDLGRAAGPCVRQFGADMLVIGGSMAAAWDLFEPWFIEGSVETVPIRTARDSECSPLFGAAWAALGNAGRSGSGTDESADADEDARMS
jgi:glucokinase